MTLRLVHPAPQGQGTRVPKGRKSLALFPTPAESARLRAALRNLRRAYGGLDALAAIMGVPEGTLSNVACGKSPGSYALIVLAARAGGITVEQILGAPAVVGRCALCGRKGAP